MGHAFVYSGNVPGATREERANTIRSLMRRTQQAGISADVHFKRDGSAIVRSNQLEGGRVKVQITPKPQDVYFRLKGGQNLDVRQAIAQRMLDRGQVIQSGALKGTQQRLMGRPAQSNVVSLRSSSGGLLNVRASDEEVRRISDIVNRQNVYVEKQNRVNALLEKQRAFVESPRNIDLAQSRWESQIAKAQEGEERVGQFAENLKSGLGLSNQWRGWSNDLREVMGAKGLKNKAYNLMLNINDVPALIGKAILGNTIDFVATAPSIIGGRITLTGIGLASGGVARESTVDALKSVGWSDVGKGAVNVVKSFNPANPGGVANILMVGGSLALLFRKSIVSGAGAVSSRELKALQQGLRDAKVVKSKVSVTKISPIKYKVRRVGTIMVKNKKVGFVETGVMSLDKLNTYLMRSGRVTLKLDKKSVGKAVYKSKSRLHGTPAEQNIVFKRGEVVSKPSRQAGIISEIGRMGVRVPTRAGTKTSMEFLTEYSSTYFKKNGLIDSVLQHSKPVVARGKFVSPELPELNLRLLGKNGKGRIMKIVLGKNVKIIKGNFVEINLGKNVKPLKAKIVDVNFSKNFKSGKGRNIKVNLGGKNTKSIRGKIIEVRLSGNKRVKPFKAKIVEAVTTKLKNFKNKLNVLSFDAVSYSRVVPKKTIVKVLSNTLSKVVKSLNEYRLKNRSKVIRNRRYNRLLKKVKVIKRELKKLKNKKAQIAIGSGTGVSDDLIGRTIGHDLNRISEIESRLDNYLRSSAVSSGVKSGIGKFSVKNLGKDITGFRSSIRAISEMKGAGSHIKPLFAFGSYVGGQSISGAFSDSVTDVIADTGAVDLSVPGSVPAVGADTGTTPDTGTIPDFYNSVINNFFDTPIIPIIPPLLPFFDIPQGNVGGMSSGGMPGWNSVSDKYFSYIPDLASLLVGRRASVGEARKLLAVGRIFTGAEIRKVV